MKSEDHLDDVIHMLTFLIYNIYVECGGRVFQLAISILMGGTLINDQSISDFLASKSMNH